MDTVLPLRKPIKRRLIVHVVIAIVFLTKAPVTAAACDNPNPISLATLSTGDPRHEARQYQPLANWLQQQMQRPVIWHTPKSYDQIVNALTHKQVDLAILGAYSYILAKNNDPDISVFGTYERQVGHTQPQGHGYHSILITKHGSHYTTITSLRGSRLALVNPGSTSGYLVPKTLFPSQIRLSFDQYFPHILFSGRHDRSILAVQQQTVDAAFVATHRMDEAIDRGQVKLKDYNILWQSASIPQDPFVYRKALCDKIKQRLQEVFFHLNQHPTGQDWLNRLNSKRIIPINDSDYDIIRKLYEKKRQSK